jgi:hypothetical protein
MNLCNEGGIYVADNVSCLKALRDEAKVVDEINIQEPLSSSSFFQDMQFVSSVLFDER